MCLRGCLLIVLMVVGASTAPTLQYDSPNGFSRGSASAETWIANGLDGVIHVYPFRPFQGNFSEEFQRTLFRDWISSPYREDKRLGEPAFESLHVKGAEAAIAASFRNFNGGAQREHLRVAVLASGRVALVDISANSPRAFESYRPGFSSLLRSLHVVESGPSGPRIPRR